LYSTSATASLKGNDITLAILMLSNTTWSSSHYSIFSHNKIKSHMLILLINTIISS
jgi:hypothetical protein